MSLSFEFARAHSPVRKRFWSKVDVRSATECWEWKASRTKKGYGSFGFVNGTEYAHRVSWILTFGDVPDGLFVCHRCDNRSCVNPNHLFLGTAKDNSEDMVNKGRSIVNEKNPMSKLKEDDVKQIRAILSSSDRPSHREIAKMFGVSSATVSLIGSNTIWKGVE